MQSLTAAYPREFTLTDNAVALWYEHMRDMDGAAFLAVIRMWIRTEERAPTIAGLLKRSHVQAGSDAEGAWAKVISAVRGGAYRQDGFEIDSQIRDAVRLCGGWGTIGQTEDEKLHFVKREFLRLYAQCAPITSSLEPYRG